MFRQQQLVLEHIAPLQSLLERYQRPVQWLQELEENTRHFVVWMPLVGGFSSGKSTLLNSLINQETSVCDLYLSKASVSAVLIYKSMYHLISTGQNNNATTAVKELFL